MRKWWHVDENMVKNNDKMMTKWWYNVDKGWQIEVNHEKMMTTMVNDEKMVTTMVNDEKMITTMVNDEKMMTMLTIWSENNENKGDGSDGNDEKMKAK